MLGEAVSIPRKTDSMEMQKTKFPSIFILNNIDQQQKGIIFYPSLTLAVNYMEYFFKRGLAGFLKIHNYENNFCIF